MFDYGDLKELARRTGCRVTDLLVLAQQNDPFYAGQPGRRERAEWFAEVWDRFGFRHGAHLRRIHYVLISQPEPVQWPDGTPYENTLNCWQYLVSASLGARYLRLVPDAVLIDRRNPEPIVTATHQGLPEPEVAKMEAGIDLDLPAEFPLPELHLTGFNRDQDHLVECWVEKSTMNDVLVPLANRLGFNLVTGLGEMSETATRLAVERAIDADKPMRILYVSDFDPAGRSMPVAVARKIEYRLHDAGLDDIDIQLHPIALTPEQCVAHRLPRTPIKESERRAGRFEERFGAGATELDALEALHPGKLEEIVRAEVGRYLDSTLSRRIDAARSEINNRIYAVEREVHGRHADEIWELSQAYDALLAHAAEIESDAADLWERIEKELGDNAPAVWPEDIPVPRPAEPIDTPLFDSTRHYLEQLDHYKIWQGK